MDEQGIYFDSDLRSAVQRVRDYLHTDCESEDCPFDRLVREVQRQEAEEGRIADEETKRRQNEIDERNEYQDGGILT